MSHSLEFRFGLILHDLGTVHHSLAQQVKLVVRLQASLRYRLIKLIKRVKLVVGLRPDGDTLTLTLTLSYSSSQRTTT